MSDSTELSILPPKESALAVFTAPAGLDPYLQKIIDECDAFVPDVSTVKGRKEIASLAHKVAKAKVALDEIGKELVADLKDVPKKIDAERKRMRDLLDDLKDKVRAPLTAWDEAEQQRVIAHEQAIAALEYMAVDLDGMTSAQLRLAVTEAEAVKLGENWEEFEVQAARAKERVVAKLHEALANREKYEAEQAELAQFRAAELVREKAEHEARIAREAADRARIEAEQRAQAERDAATRREADAKAAADRRELELKLQAEQAERAVAQAEINRLAAIQQAEKDRIAAEQRQAQAVEQARLAEIKRQADAKAAEEAETARREADKKHKAKINNAALAAFIDQGLPEDCAKKAVVLIAKGGIPGVKISY